MRLRVGALIDTYKPGSVISKSIDGVFPCEVDVRGRGRVEKIAVEFAQHLLWIGEHAERLEPIHRVEYAFLSRGQVLICLLQFLDLLCWGQRLLS